MRFSVVIPLYNKESYIARALASVQGQTVRDFEIVVVDDGSTDGGSRIVARCAGPGLRLLRQENAGVSAARNRGIEEARGGWIAFLDADDVWKPDYLETISRLIKQHPEAGAYATAYECIMPGGTVLSPKYHEIGPAPWEGVLPSYFRSSLAQQPVCSSATTVPRRIFAELGAFALGVPTGEDIDMWGRIALNYPIAFSTRVGASYFQDDGLRHGNRRGYFAGNPEPAFLRTARETIKRGELGPDLLRDLNEYLAKIQIDLGYDCLLNHENQLTARKLVLKASPGSWSLRKRKYRVLLQTLLPGSFLKLFYGKTS
jgi:glycosyltransferase involved in cell wall biosynthesis